MQHAALPALRTPTSGRWAVPVQVERLDWREWLVSIALGAVSLPLSQVLRLAARCVLSARARGRQPAPTSARAMTFTSAGRTVAGGGGGGAGMAASSPGNRAAAGGVIGLAGALSPQGRAMDRAGAPASVEESGAWGDGRTARV